MLFEIHTPTNEVIALKNVPNTASAILSTKGYSNASKQKFNSLVLYEVAETGKKQIDLSSYNYNELKRKRPKKSNVETCR